MRKFKLFEAFQKFQTFKSFKSLIAHLSFEFYEHEHETRSRRLQLRQRFLGEALDLFLALRIVRDHELQADVDDADGDELFQSSR